LLPERLVVGCLVHWRLTVPMALPLPLHWLRFLSLVLAAGGVGWGWFSRRGW
jgi:hypothetical protein